MTVITQSAMSLLIQVYLKVLTLFHYLAQSQCVELMSFIPELKVLKSTNVINIRTMACSFPPNFLCFIRFWFERDEILHFSIKMWKDVVANAVLRLNQTSHITVHFSNSWKLNTPPFSTWTFLYENLILPRFLYCAMSFNF